MEKQWKIITILSFILTLITALAALSDTIIRPDIKVDTKFLPMENTTNAQITIRNNGLEPATSLRITINPQFNILEWSTIHYTEEIRYDFNGPQSLIGHMERLANGQKVVIETLLSSPLQIEHFSVVITHDKGSTTYNLNDPVREIISDSAIGVLISFGIASVAAIISQVIRKKMLKREYASTHNAQISFSKKEKFMFKNPEKNQKHRSDSSEAKIKGEIIYVKTNAVVYKEGDAVVISGKVKPVILDAPVALQIFYGDTMIQIDQLSVAQDGTFTTTLIAKGPQWKNYGTYLVRSSYSGSIYEITFEVVSL